MPTIAQYHGSLTSKQKEFRKKNWELTSEFNIRNTSDWVEGTVYVADQTTAIQYTTIEPGLPHFTLYRVTANYAKPRQNHDGRIFFAKGRVNTVFMRPYSTCPYRDELASAYFQKKQEYCHEFQRN